MTGYGGAVRGRHRGEGGGGLEGQAVGELECEVVVGAVGEGGTGSKRGGGGG